MTTVNEVLVGRISPKDEGAVKIVNSVPLFHSNLALFRPFEISLIMVLSLRALHADF